MSHSHLSLPMGLTPVVVDRERARVRAQCHPWPDTVGGLHPGAYLVVLDATPAQVLHLRRHGFQVRDTLLSVGYPTRRVVLARKPLREATVVAQVLATGSGALWVDGCRVGGGVARSINHYVSVGAQGCVNRPGETSHAGEGFRTSETTMGRFPSNLLLTHMPECRPAGTRKVRSDKPRAERGSLGGFHPTNRVFGTGTGERVSTGYADDDGLETVSAWECQAGCLVSALDDQSGVTTSGAMKREVGAYEGDGVTGFLRGKSGPSNQHGDTGGASRFYPQFAGSEGVEEWCRKLVGA